jgi:zinc protease
MNIKVILSCIMLMVFIASSFAQTQVFEVDGVKVILRKTEKSIVAFSWFIEGGTINYSKEQQGIEYLTLLTMTEGGAGDMSPDAFNSELERIGAELSGEAEYDYGLVTMSCINEHWNTAWDLFAYCLTDPRFDSERFELIREQSIAETEYIEYDPDELLLHTAMGSVFEDKDYSKRPMGTSKSLKSISSEDLKSYHKERITKKSGFLVVIGNIGKDEVVQKVKKSLVKIPEGTAVPNIEKIDIGVKHHSRFKNLETNYLRGYLNAPRLESEEGLAMEIAMELLSNRLFAEIRNNRGLSYAPMATYATGIVNHPYNFLYASTDSPGEVIEVMISEIDRARKEGFDNNEFNRLKQMYMTNYYLRQESTSAIIYVIGFAELRKAGQYTEDLPEMVKNLSLEDVNVVFKKYSEGVYWVYLGNKRDFKNVKFLQPNVK